MKIAYGTLGTLALIAAVAFATTQATGYWQLPLFALGPDVTLFLGVGRGLARGQLHPRAVGPYNLVHRLWGPTALVVVAAVGWLPLGYLVGGLAWAAHVGLDRALGYGLRTRDGFQRS